MDAKKRAAALIRDGATTVIEAAKSLHVELRGNDGQPFCCGQRMDVRVGIVGADYAKCQICSNLLYRIDSPHTNGGYVIDQELLDRLGGRVWMAVRGGNGPGDGK